MDINTKTLQSNTFSKGMNTDLSDALIGNDQYRLANNLRFVTNTEENTGELHLIEGATHNLAQADNAQNFEVSGSIIASTEIRNYGVIITKGEDSWSVWRFDGTDHTEVVCIDNDDCDIESGRISLVTKYEDEDNIKVYIADGKHPVMVVNIMTADGIITDYRKISSYPPFDPIAPDFVNITNGYINAPVVQYCYQLYNTHGQITEMSTPTNMIYLRKQHGEKIEGVLPEKRSGCGVKISICINETNTVFDSIKIYRISYIEAGQLPLIELIVDRKILNSEKYTPATQGHQVDDGYVNLTDAGIEALEVLTLEEFNSVGGIHIIPSVIESKDDYMFAAKIKTQQSDIDNTIKNAIRTLDNKDGLRAPQIEYDLNDDPVDFYDMSECELSASYFKTGSLWNTYSSLAIPDQNISVVSWHFTTHDFIVDEHPNNQLLSNGQNVGWKSVKNSYMYPSLRRNEMYRFGIVFYTLDGARSSVFWIADVRTPYHTIAPPFYVYSNKLFCSSLGIHFDINIAEIQQRLDDYTQENSIQNISILGYEIVRAIRTESDVCSIAQGVLSRPGRRYNNNNNETDRSLPLSPTGWLTTADFAATINGFVREPAVYAADPTSWPAKRHSRWQYTNSSAIYQTIDGNVYHIGDGNTRYFLFVCPESCYLSESILDLAKNSQLSIVPLLYTYGGDLTNNGTLSLLTVEDTVSDSTHLTYTFVPETSGSKNLSSYDLLLNYVRFGNINTYIPYLHGGTNSIINIHYPSAASSALYRTNGQQTSFEDSSNSALSMYATDASYYQYVKLYNFLDLVKIESSAIDVFNNTHVNTVSDVSYAEALKWNNVSDYKDKLVSIGDDSYVNWVATNLFGMPIEWNGVENDNYHVSNYELDDHVNVAWGGIQGPGGRCLLLDIPNGSNIIKRTAVNVGTLVPQTICGTYICDLRKTNCSPYGMPAGSSQPDDTQLALTNYYSYGKYYPVKYTNVLNHDVFIGDTFILPFEYVSMHKWYHNSTKHPRNSCIIYSIPVESSINVAFSSGYEFSKKGTPVNIQDQPSDVFGLFSQSSPLYEYNGAYSSNSKAKVYAAYQDDPSNIKNEDYRCYHSQPKANNEKQDNWLIYRPANFLDVDTRMGPITGLRRFHNNLVFWLEMATGLFSVNERTTITDDSNLPLMLGTGGILARYDYINTSNGMHEGEFADTQSDSTLYWWDHNKWELCAYAGGQESVVLSKIKGIQNFLNKQRNSGSNNTRPLLAFDKKYNELIACVTNGSGHEEGSLVYSELMQAFSSLYSIKPAHKMSFADSIYFATDDTYVWNNATTNYNFFKWNEKSYGNVSNSIHYTEGIRKPLKPYLKYIVNDNTPFVKVYDTCVFGGRFYRGTGTYRNNLKFTFKTPLKQKAKLDGSDKTITDREYDFRFAIPRAGKVVNDQWVTEPYGDRMRGKTMQCELWSDSNDLDFSLQYITTKYRISWS